MSTKSKSNTKKTEVVEVAEVPKVSKEAKVAKGAKVAEVPKVDEGVEDMETHSIWYGRFKSNPIEAKFFKEFMIELGNIFIDEAGVKQIYSHYWGKSEQELDDLIKLQNKREKKVKEKFTPDNLNKAKNAYNLYCTHYASICAEKEEKFTLSNASTSWKNLGDKEKEKFNKEALKQKEEYDAKYKSMKLEAIKNGSLSADKPKGPITAFFRYLDENRENIEAKLVKAGETEKLNTKITSEAGKLWKELSDKAKEPYEKAYNEEKEKYKVLLEDWKNKETSRLKKLDGKSEDIKVEESGDKASTEAEESEPVIEKVSKSKPKTKKPASVETSDQEDEVPVKEKVEKKSEKAEKATKTEKAEKTTKVEKTEKVEKAEKSKKVEKVVAKKVNLIEEEDEDEDEEE